MKTAPGPVALVHYTLTAMCPGTTIPIHVQLSLRCIFYELGVDCPRSVPLKCDNQSTIKQSINQVDQRRCRHLGMRTHYLRQQCHAGLLQLEYVPSALQRGDIFTKCLYRPQHETLRSALKVMRAGDFRSTYPPGKLHTTKHTTQTADP